MIMNKLNVLIADDDQDIRAFVRTVLKAEIVGCEIHEAVDGEDALKQCRQLSIDLVLLDLVMPKKDGFEVVQQLKVLGVPFVALTATVNVEAIRRLLELGSFSFLAKPVSDGQLLGTVLSAMSHIAHIAAIKRYADANADVCTAKGAIAAYLSIHPDQAFDVINEMGRDQQGGAKDTAEEVMRFLNLLGNANNKFAKQQARRLRRRPPGR